ncbi:RIO1 family regulatory kinase/ATPase domain-containing protein [Tengunoibacter tsumagoiensis]|uniref:non-specific serine/threonine protein kinase n=1 Tax=Tengunoibacter tsumagoiensis TaxID=2014871 RepID=A0A402A6B2_9CHLR|nr:RIO1 family regulatory kinase/ATPase [Tengunoibacter tsumagoiensis]GCE14674.1 serine protein kinase RIO [Tengunoibacter tsumagoiensis]
MSKRKLARAMDEIEEQEALAALAGQHGDPIQALLDPFLAGGLITEVLDEVKSGKEATVYCCRAHPSQNVPYLAAKVYRSRNNRGFKNDSVYQEGRVIGPHRIRRAVQNKSTFGREVQFSLWIGYEYETLTLLHAQGADIPRPISRTDNAILMEYFGNLEAPAPSLHHTELDPQEAYAVFARLMDNVQLFLKHNIIHGDLSAYNILYWQGRATIIDFPQAVDPRFNPHAFNLLARDIDNLCKYIGRYGIQRDSRQLTERLWYQFKNAQL